LHLKLWCSGKGSIGLKTFCLEHHHALSVGDVKMNEFQCYRQLQVFWGVTLWLWVVVPLCLGSSSPPCLDSFVPKMMALQFETSGAG
jgi:hypothetical protein